MYKQKAKKGVDPQVHDIPGFFKELFPDECKAVVDVFCDPPFREWREITGIQELPIRYHFAMGCHPHNAKNYDDGVESEILEAMKHPYIPSLSY